VAIADKEGADLVPALVALPGQRRAISGLRRGVATSPELFGYVGVELLLQQGAKGLLRGSLGGTVQGLKRLKTAVNGWDV
jgi:hypothetical protein